MQIHAEHTRPSHTPSATKRKPIPNPRGNQTVAQPRPVTPRAPDGRFTSPFRPLAGHTRP